MAQKKIVDVELGSVFSGDPMVENYVAKTKSLVVKNDDNGFARVVLETETVPCESLGGAQQFVANAEKDIASNLSVVAHPYLIYSVQSLDNSLHPCRSVYVKYGIVEPLGFRGRMPVILPNGRTTLRYDASSTGERETEWLSGSDVPKIKFQNVPDNVRLPDSWHDVSAKYAFIDCAFFFEEPEFARAFRDEMLVQQALRRYMFYKKIEKTW